MSAAVSKLTVLFEDPFWIGIYERENKGKYQVCKITFGSEPKDYDVYEYLNKNWSNLRFSSPVKAKIASVKKLNPKRMQRDIKKQLDTPFIGTKAQVTLKLEHEKCKFERKAYSSEQRDEDKQRQFELRLEKHKAKHRGH